MSDGTVTPQNVVDESADLKRWPHCLILIAFVILQPVGLDQISICRTNSVKKILSTCAFVVDPNECAMQWPVECVAGRISATDKISCQILF